jgi:hypothetical protein
MARRDGGTRGRAAIARDPNGESEQGCRLPLLLAVMFTHRGYSEDDQGWLTSSWAIFASVGSTRHAKVTASIWCRLVGNQPPGP